jgi:hypothetical protein
MTKPLDVTFGRAVIVFASMALAVGVGIYSEQYGVLLFWRILAWAVIALGEITLWHYKAICRRPALFHTFLAGVVMLAVFASVAFFLGDCGPC